MKQDPNEDVKKQGGIPLDMVQRYLNLWFALSLDLFGGEISSNAASFFANGLKGRYKEDTYDDHTALRESYRMSVPKDGTVVEEDVPTPPAKAEKLHARIVGSRLVWIPGAGHSSTVAPPALVKEALGGILDSVEGKAG